MAKSLNVSIINNSSVEMIPTGYNPGNFRYDSGPSSVNAGDTGQWSASPDDPSSPMQPSAYYESQFGNIVDSFGIVTSMPVDGQNTYYIDQPNGIFDASPDNTWPNDDQEAKLTLTITDKPDNTPTYSGLSSDAQTVIQILVHNANFKDKSDLINQFISNKLTVRRFSQLARS